MSKGALLLDDFHFNNFRENDRRKERDRGGQGNKDSKRNYKDNNDHDKGKGREHDE